MGFVSLAAVTILPAVLATRVHVIDVGGANLTYTPSTVFAKPGDLVSFNFLAKNHTVVESAFETPCEPLDGGIFAGFHAGGTGSFTVEIKDTKPRWIYCAQAMHCQAGMVAVINPPANPAKTQCTFAQLAAKAPKNIPGKVIEGGEFTPNDPAPAACSNSSSTSNSTSSPLSAGPPGDTVRLAISDGATQSSGGGGDFTAQIVVPLTNTPFSDNSFPANLTTLSLVLADGTTSLNNIGCAAIIDGKLSPKIAKAGMDADISVNGGLATVTAVQCGILSSISSSKPTMTTLATSATSYKRTTTTSTSSAAASQGSVRVQFDNNADDSSTQSVILLNGYPVTISTPLTSISFVFPVDDAICNVQSMDGKNLGSVTNGQPLALDNVSGVTLECGLETESND